MLEENPGSSPQTSADASPEDLTTKRVTRSRAFRHTQAPDSTPRVIKKARRRVREKWSSDAGDYAWDNSQGSGDSDELHHIILSPNRSFFEPVFEPGTETRGQDQSLIGFSPASPLPELPPDRWLPYSSGRRFTFSGVRRFSTADIHGVVASLLFPNRSASGFREGSGLFSELARDALPAARRLSLEFLGEAETPPAADMADLQAEMRARRLLVREAVNAGPEFIDFEFDVLPETFIRAACEKASKFKDALNESTAVLEDGDQTYGPPLKDEADAARIMYRKFVIDAQKKIFELEAAKLGAERDLEREAWERAAREAAAARLVAAPPPPPATAALQFKARKVAAYETETVASLNALYEEFSGLMRTRPQSEKDTKKAEDRLSALSKRAETAVREGRALAGDAADSGQLDSAEAIEKEVRRINTIRDETLSQLSEVKIGLGVIGSGGSIRTEDLEPPKFSGDLEKLDYYTWARELDEYFQAKNLNNSQQLSIVKKSCLQGVPATACLEMDSVDEILRFLRNFYGNAGLMVDAKIRDFRKLGKCVGGAIKRRDWIVRAKQKLESLHKLALTHKIETHLYYSTLISEVHQSLPHEAQKGFREKMDDMGVSCFDKGEMFSQTVDFLGELEQKTNFQVNFEINMGAAKAEDKQQSGKKTYNIARGGTTSDSGDSDSSVEEIYSHKNPRVQAVYSPPQAKNCKLCNVKHEYLFYCEKFQSTRVRDRFKHTRTTRVCMRCLRMDSQVDFNDRMEWFKGHVKDCQTEWQCIEGDCAKKERDKQFHFLMCNRHINANKDRVDSFKKKLDRALITPTTKFLYNVPRIYNLEDVVLPQVSRHPPGVDVEADINEPAIFLMQNYETPEGRKMLIMYDSGCSAAALTEAAASSLETEVLRPGPTEMGVAGGRTIIIQGGDVRFWLATPRPNQLVSITGLVMPEITTPFPVYPLAEAFEELKKSHSQDQHSKILLPSVPKNVGGTSVGIMMGIRYVRYFPKLLYSLNCGLGIYEAQFKTPDGNLGILGGPHKSWRAVHNSSQIMSPAIFLTQEMKAYKQECITIRHLIKDFQHLDVPDCSDDEIACLDLSGLGELAGESAEPVQIIPDRPDVEAVCLKLTGLGRLAGEKAEPVRNLTIGRVSLAEKVDPGQDILNASPSLAESAEELRATCSVEACSSAESSVTLSVQELSQPEKIIICQNKHCLTHEMEAGWSVPAHWDVSASLYTVKGDFEEYLGLENCGTELTYRCIKCRNCVDCRNSEFLEKSSLQDERQQALLESCVTLDIDSKTLWATLPLIQDPVKNLKPNKGVAKKMLDSQLKRLATRPELIPDVLKAHNKLRDKGYVLPIKDLPEKARQAMELSDWEGYYLPWSVVLKESMSTPARQVFNASSRTPGGLSLNQVLAKGQNMLPKIFEVLTKFRGKKHGFIADIGMAYNSIRLTEEYYVFQKYLWREGCDPSSELMEFVVITLIYGVICSGGMTTAGISKTADHCIESYPEHAEGAMVLKDSIYVDDVAKSTNSLEESQRLAKGVEFTLQLGSMAVKDFTFVGLPPSAKVSADGETVGLLGYVWWPVTDLLGINIKPLFLEKAKKGQRPSPVTGDIKKALSESFDRRTLTGKAASVFDPQGLVTPITSRFKMNLSEIVSLRLGWDDPIPERFLDVWTNNLDDMERLKALRFPRSILHPDAVSNGVELIISMDASENIAVAAVHSRSLLPDGSYDCRLVAAKSKLVSLSTIPRAELRAAVLGATLAHVVKRCLGDQVVKTTYVTDSTVVLFWIHADQRPLQTAVRNGVIEIRRLSSLADWRHVASADNIADVGTRHVEVSEITESSAWVKGHPWMSLPSEQMPLKTIDEVLMNQLERQAAQKEFKTSDICGVFVHELTGKIADRYSFSDYAVDPCVLDWPKSVRVLAFVKKFIRVLRAKVIQRKLSAASDESRTPTTPLKQPRVSTNNVNTALEGQKNFFGSGLPTEIFEEMPKISPPGGSQVPVAVPGPVVSLSAKEVSPTRLNQGKDLPPTLAGLIKDWQLESWETEEAEKYFFKKGTDEVKHFTKEAEYKDCSILEEGILKYSSRILDGQQIDDVENVMDDLAPLSFCKPMLDRWSPIAYSIMIHSHQKAARHRNAVATLLESRKLAFIVKGRSLANEIRDACVFCRRFRAKLVEVEMGKVHSSRLTVAPAFFRVQTDLFGPLMAMCEHNHRAAVSVWGCIFKDPASGAISVHAMPKYDTGAFLAAYSRHSFRYGHPARLYIDGGSQLVKACRDMHLNWAELTTTLNSEYSVGVEYEVCAVGRHDRHGVVERAVQDVKKLFYQVFQGLKLDLFAYETAFAFVANELNSLPICLGSKYEGLEHTDLITANRLVLGRNNKRAPVGYPRIESKSRQIEQMDRVHKAWWKVWKNEKLVDHIPHPPKWFTNSRPPEVGDIVVYLKQDKDVTLGDTLWRLGRIVEVIGSEGDGKVRSVKIEYSNPKEEVYRYTHRSARKVAILFREGELEMTEMLNAAARKGNQLFIKHMRMPGGPPLGYTQGKPE